MHIEIDQNSGFCHGVTTAISKAEEELSNRKPLYCLGDIVHNDQEVKRLEEMGLITVCRDDLSKLQHKSVLLRAHGEPPLTYQLAKDNDITLVDATCPVVLQLQKRIKRIYQQKKLAQIIIFGKKGHAEVIGLVGQTAGTAIVVQQLEEMSKVNFNRDIYLFSQTTMPLNGFHELIRYVETHIKPPAEFHYFDTICRQVANRLPHIQDFARNHDVIIFACGLKSSNGKVLYEACRKVNNRSHRVTSAQNIKASWFDKNTKTVGICGATSTPKWLMEACAKRIEQLRTEIK